MQIYYRVYLGFVRVSCVLPNYWAAVQWARDFADSVEGNTMGRPLIIVREKTNA